VDFAVEKWRLNRPPAISGLLERAQAGIAGGEDSPGNDTVIRGRYPLIPPTVLEKQSDRRFLGKGGEQHLGIVSWFVFKLTGHRLVGKSKDIGLWLQGMHERGISRKTAIRIWDTPRRSLLPR